MGQGITRNGASAHLSHNYAFVSLFPVYKACGDCLISYTDPCESCITLAKCQVLDKEFLRKGKLGGVGEGFRSFLEAETQLMKYLPFTEAPRVHDALHKPQPFILTAVLCSRAHCLRFYR